jgi:hypothetical protein
MMRDLYGDHDNTIASSYKVLSALKCLSPSSHSVTHASVHFTWPRIITLECVAVTSSAFLFIYVRLGFGLICAVHTLR